MAVVAIVAATSTVTFMLQWTPSNQATLGTNQSVLIREVASFQVFKFVNKAYFGTFWKWPEYRGGHISEVQIRGSPL